MDENKWLRRKPQSNLDYLGITLIAVAFYMACSDFLFFF